MRAAAADPGGRQTILARLLDEATDPLLALDENGTIVVANAAAAALFGRERQHLRGKPFAVLVALDDRRAYRRAFHELGPRKPQAYLSVRLAAADAADEARPLYLRRLRGPAAVCAVRIDTKGTYVPFVPPVHPPEEVVALEAERFLLRLPQAVIGVQADGRIAFANARARRLFRETPLRRGQPLPVSVADVPLQRLASRLVDRPGPLPPQLLELPDGRTIRVTGTGAQKGIPAVLVLDDITRHVARSAADRLFVQNAAHQLRTPLAGIVNAVELLQAGAKDDPDARDRFLAHLERETERLTRLARSLLVLARAQSGVQAPRLDFVELAAIFDRIVERLEAPAAVEVVVSCPPGLTALAEADLLEEALTALAENAVRHTREGTVTFRCASRGDGTVDIEITDSGDGILPEHKELIFDPFFRGTPDGDGFGLGLSIAAQAVSALGATLDVDSAPLRGTRFSFRLPAAEVVRA